MTSDAVAIDMLLFPGMNEGEVAAPGLGLRRARLWKGDSGGTKRRRLQPPAVVEQPPGQSRRPKLDADDFPHAATMPGRLAAHLSGMPRICGFLCRFRADVALTLPWRGIL